ncbi:MAG: A24 family peptidase [Eubacteriales bacterium]|nr:A24 family peptidase [Eubacteriales bacterium]
MLFSSGLPVVMAAGAMLMDLRRGRVDNGWILFGLFIGLWTRLLAEGPKGIFPFLGGGILPLLVLWWLFALHMLGAGDIKLFCVLGGFLGMVRILKCILCSMVIGAALSGAILVSCGNVRERLCYFIHYIRNLQRTKKRLPYSREGVEHPENFHFTVPVFLSVLLCVGGVY